MPCLLQNLTIHYYANKPKTSPKKRNFRYSAAVRKGLKKVINLFQISLYHIKKVKFAKFSTKQVLFFCNVKNKEFQCLMLII